ncbi:MAG: thioredoxin domain-containing protein [Acidobacteriota bacterium]|nr:thioredoxin domain-containing protein [Acidobacteriota bacterium]
MRAIAAIGGRAARAVPMAAAAAALLAPAAIAAVEPEAVPFAMTGRYQLSVDNEVVGDASLYLTEKGIPRLIVSSERFSLPLLVVAGRKMASALDAAVLKGGADRVSLPESALAPGDRGVVPVHVEGARVLFEWEGKRVAIEPREPMLGPVPLADIVEQLPEYRRNAEKYNPQKGTITLLGELDARAEVQVFFGSWCPHCERLIPRLIKVIEQVDSPNLVFRFHGVPRKLYDDPLARQYNVQGLPALILRREGANHVLLEAKDLVQPELALAGALIGNQ